MDGTTTVGDAGAETVPPPPHWGVGGGPNLGDTVFVSIPSGHHFPCDQHLLLFGSWCVNIKPQSLLMGYIVGRTSTASLGFSEPSAKESSVLYLATRHMIQQAEFEAS